MCRLSRRMPEAKKIIDRIIAELDFNLYEKDDSSKRRIMRNYGVRFEYTKNEPKEEDDDGDSSPEEENKKLKKD